MEEFTEKIQIPYRDNAINAILKSSAPGAVPFSRHFSHNEEFFLNTSKDFIIPQLPVHHDIAKSTPDKKYAAIIKELITGLAGLAPGLFCDLIYIFDPADIHKLKFLKLYKIEQSQYLYFLVIDLLYKTHYHEIIDKGNNDFTPQYRTQYLFLESAIIPVEKETAGQSNTSYFPVKQTISETWIGEKGRGYLLKGIWMDDDLTKFFSKLFLPAGKRIYPYYPLVCKYKTVCLNIIDFSHAMRKTLLPYLHRVLKFLIPNMDSIQEALKKDTFSENLPLFITLKKQIPEALQIIWENVKVTPYLNNNNLKEYSIET